MCVCLHKDVVCGERERVQGALMQPSLPTALQGRAGRQGAKCTSWMRFKHIEPEHVCPERPC